MAVPDDPPPPGPKPASSPHSGARLTAKDTQIAELRAALRERDRTIATLHGELEKRTERRPASAAVIADDPTRAVTEQRRIPGSCRPGNTTVEEICMYCHKLCDA